MLNFIKIKIQRLLYNCKNTRIQHIISISFTVIAVVGMIMVGGVLYLRFINSDERMVQENNKAILEQVNLNLDSYLRNIMRVSDTAYYNVIKKKDLSLDRLDKEMNLLYEFNKDSLVTISIFSKYGDLIASAPTEKLKPSVITTQRDWFLKAINKTENIHFSTCHVQNLFKDVNHKYQWVISLSRAVELTSSGRTNTGVLLVDMNFDKIEKICKGVNLGKLGYVYLIDSNGEIIYHPRQQLIYSDLIKENELEVKYEDGTHIESFEGEKRLVTVRSVAYTGWKIVGVTPMADITSDYKQISLFVIFITSFASCILVFLNMFVSSRIANPIKLLEKSVKNFEEGINDGDICISGSYEVQNLGRAIKSMINQLHILMENVVKEQESKRESELNALQAQINPHFLYNTLDSIIWMIENENYDGAITMVTALARLFRISLSKGRNIISVRDEIEHVRNYLTIQNIRYKNKFIYNIEVEDRVLNLATIKLIIQPLVENAIYHGMAFMDEDGEILIRAYLRDNDLCIDVIDNGPGMVQKSADDILMKDVITKKKGSGIGLKNVYQRIQIYYGIKYGLKIYSEPDEGVTVRIQIPAIDLDDVLNKENRNNEK